ncbi:pre-mRNA-splicing factor 38A [Kwoniella heveanensis BCC8398]|uniref:Pre-mRNA-splicing factor 38 n=1 Tax=Kwoniella heveanensis BCC8398 TaxID=1296120 RepID=A0A1B9GRL4_9TREE|nr:pre-mRNA-splicing factor 38A [Kwoniella heveanensis BCC8398]
MANSALRGTKSIHGGNPQFLIEKVIRARIYDSLYWKEQCFALTAESIIDKAITLHSLGGVTDRQTPTPFISLTLKLLQLQPEKEILIEYLLAEEYKYLRALAAFYIRLTFRSMEVYEILEPLMKDYRKLRVAHAGGYSLTYFDEFIDDLLTKERVCDIILPRLTQRSVLEETEGLPPRKSLLDEDEGIEGNDASDDEAIRSGASSPDRRRYISRSPSRTPSRSRSRPRSASSSSSGRGRYISRSPSLSGSESDGGEKGDTRGRFVSRSPSMSPDRMLVDNDRGEDDDEKLEGDV